MDEPTTPPAETFASELLLRLPQPRHAEDQLMFAVLVDAVALLRESAFGGQRHSRRLITDTLAWFANDDADWPLSFCSICRALGLDAAVLRAALDRELAAADGWSIRVHGGEVRALPPPRTQVPVEQARRRFLGRSRRQRG